MSEGFPDTIQTMLAKIRELGPEGDAAQWVRFWDLYAPAMRTYAARKGGEENADDIMMLVLGKLVAVIREGKYDPTKGAFHSYLATMIANEVHMQHRKDVVRRRGAHVSIDAPCGDDPDGEGLSNVIPSEVVTPPEALDAEWRQALLETATEHALSKTALTPRDAEIYRAFVQQGRPIDEVAAAYGMSRNCVSQIACRIRKRIEARAKELIGGAEAPL